MSKKDNFITVGQLNESIKTTLATQFPDSIKVKGEISGLKISNNNTFLNLKDEESGINVVAWGKKFENVKNGDGVIVSGKLCCYTKQGIYQILATKIDRIGVGNLHEQMEKNKKMFDERGYFEKSKNRKELPSNIKRIALLTSVEGAVIQDILSVLRSNMFYGEIYVKNCSVQGQLCPETVADGIEYFENIHKTKHIDILVVARGGGSFEDLIGYSSKEVVKAIYNTPIYTISAIGHEPDVMLSDFAANYRAPTPSIAGEVISKIQKNKKELLEKNINDMEKIKAKISNKISMYYDKINNNLRLLKTIDPKVSINNEIDRLYRLKTRMHDMVDTKFNEINVKIKDLHSENNMYDPNKIFKSGYVGIVDSGYNLISDTKSFNKAKKNKEKLKIIFVDGEVEL